MWDTPANSAQRHQEVGSPRRREDPEGGAGFGGSSLLSSAPGSPFLWLCPWTWKIAGPDLGPKSVLSPPASQAGLASPAGPTPCQGMLWRPLPCSATLGWEVGIRWGLLLASTFSAAVWGHLRYPTGDMAWAHEPCKAREGKQRQGWQFSQGKTTRFLNPEQAQSRVPLQLAPALSGTLPILFGAFPTFDLEINNKKKKRRADDTDPSQTFTAPCSRTSAVSPWSLHPGPLGRRGDGRAEHRLGAETQAGQSLAFHKSQAFPGEMAAFPLPWKACFN